MGTTYRKVDLGAPISEEDGGEIEKFVARYAVTPCALFATRRSWTSHGRSNPLPERMAGFAERLRIVFALRRHMGLRSVLITS